MTTPPGEEMEQDKQLTYSQRFKQECSQAAGLCFWDRLVDSFKTKGKDGEQAPPAARSINPMGPGMEPQLQQQQEEYEGQLQTQRDHFQTQIQGLQEQLKQQQLGFDEKLAQQQQGTDQRLEEDETTIEQLKRELRQSRERSMEVQNISELVQQYEFVVPNFSQLKRDKISHNTPPMYSKPGGYKFVLEISAAGTKAVGAGSDLSVRAFTSLGEYDKKLVFPAKIYIILQLLNQQNKSDGAHTKTLACIYKQSSNGEFLGSDQRFISFTELEKNASMYLKNDQLWFRITEIKVDTIQSK